MLLETDILVTTADHVESDGHDSVRQPHFGFRYTEALAAGAALVAPFVRGTEHIVRAHRDNVAFESLTDAADRIVKLCSNAIWRAEVARGGEQSLSRLVEDGWLWRSAKSAIRRTQSDYHAQYLGPVGSSASRPNCLPRHSGRVEQCWSQLRYNRNALSLQCLPHQDVAPNVARRGRHVTKTQD